MNKLTRWNIEADWLHLIVYTIYNEGNHWFKYITFGIWGCRPVQEILLLIKHIDAFPLFVKNKKLFIETSDDFNLYVYVSKYQLED